MTKSVPASKSRRQSSAGTVQRRTNPRLHLAKSGSSVDGDAVTMPSGMSPGPASIYEQARRALHVAAVPELLPGRELEYAEILGRVESALGDRQGCCICMGVCYVWTLACLDMREHVFMLSRFRVMHALSRLSRFRVMLRFLDIR